MKDINIVIVNYKMKTDIERCLASLYKDLANDNLNINIVVVDNASNDGVDLMLKEKYPAVKIILREKNDGFGKAQNAGLKSDEAKYHFILNPDTVFLENGKIIRKMYDFMETHPKIGMIGPKIVYPDNSLQYSCYRFPIFLQPVFSRTKLGQKKFGKKVSDKFLMKDFDHNSTRPVDWIMGSAMFVRGEALKQEGLFDDRFWMYAEDSDLCRRFWEAHWPVYYVHDIVIQHWHGRGSAKVPGVFRALVKNKLARVHLISWLKYMWKWRGNSIYYR